MQRNRWFAIGAAALVALAAVWYFASPGWTLQRMRAAAVAGDSDALVAMIDFPALREDVKAELMAKLAIEARRDPRGAGALGMVLGGALIGPIIDGMISPAAIRAGLLARDEGAGAGTGPKLPNMKLPEQPVIVRRGLSEFLVASKTDRSSGLVFHRDGLSWKLSGIELPPGPAGPARPSI